MRHHDEHDGDGHHDHDRIVELMRVSSRFEADMLAAKLEANGVRATVQHGDAGGWAPQFASVDGHSVLVFDSDLAVAREIVAPDDAG